MKKNIMLWLILVSLGCTNKVCHENRPSDISLAENLTIEFYTFRSQGLNDSIYKNYKLEFERAQYEKLIFSIDSSLGKIAQMNIDSIYTNYTVDQNGGIGEYSIKLNNVYQNGTCVEYIEFVNRENQVSIRNLEMTPIPTSN